MPPKLDGEEQQDDPESVARVSFRIPPFWRTNLGLWFAQVEAQFSTASIVSEAKKYNTIVAAIESEILAQVSDIILGPSEGQTYKLLKERLISTFADSEQQRLRKLLSEIALDDKKPSQLLREMRELGGRSVPEDLLKTLWTQRLSSQTKAILTAHTGNLAALATLVYKIQEVTQPSNVSAVSATSTRTQQYDRLERQIAELTKQVASPIKVSITFQFRGRT